MKISLNWLKDYVDIDEKLSHEKLSNLITTRTAEVEGYEDLSKSFKNIVAGRIKSIKPHPDADKLTVTEVSVGDETLQIVCGAANIYEGMYAPVAMPGAIVKWHGKGEPVELKKAKVRGVESYGMLCAGEEIGLENNTDGIYDLSGLKVKEGQNLAEIFEKDDIVFEIDNKSLTHRPDLWGHYGMAREVSAILKKTLKKVEPEITIPKEGESVLIDVKDKDLCPRYCGIIIKNIKVDESPQWLKNRLLAVGYRPVSNIVDVTNYVMAELGQPLHAFDKNFIKKGIVVRRAEKDEQITTLDGQKRKLDADMLIIADHEKPVAVAGVMGGENSEIHDGTTEIIIESANFNAESVRKTSSRLGLRTEAVQRFEKDLDPALSEKAIKRTCELILKLCPEAKIAGPQTDVKNVEIKEPEVELDVDQVSSKIGVEMSSKDCREILESLEFKTEKEGENILRVKVPSFRATKDIDIAADLVEEIARMYGYENIPETLPKLPIISPPDNRERRLKHEARTLLAYGFNLTEVSNYSFYGLSEISKTLISERKHIMLSNYLSEDQTHLRTTLVPNILRNIKDNLRYRDTVKIFEIGRIYRETGDYFPLEEKWITGACSYSKKPEIEPFYEAKAIVEDFINKFLNKTAQIKEAKDLPPYAHPSRSAAVLVDGKETGHIFEVHPLVLNNWDMEAKTAMFELNFTLLANTDEKIVKYKKLPKYPGLEIDISVVVGLDKTVAEVEGEIKKADKNLIKRIKLFDIYEGENIEKGKKALAFKVFMQADDRTLTDDEMAGVQKKIFENLKKAGGIVRGT
jgi:phenylalanyl-tRNA synthetase beta chain